MATAPIPATPASLLAHLTAAQFQILADIPRA
jgi:hypothetical protein